MRASVAALGGSGRLGGVYSIVVAVVVVAVVVVIGFYVFVNGDKSD